jgi:hypothetical protein
MHHPDRASFRQAVESIECDICSQLWKTFDFSRRMDITQPELEIEPPQKNLNMVITALALPLPASDTTQINLLQFTMWQEADLEADRHRRNTIITPDGVFECQWLRIGDTWYFSTSRMGFELVPASKYS